jgi:hypothetical protein
MRFGAWEAIDREIGFGFGHFGIGKVDSLESR